VEREPDEIQRIGRNADRCHQEEEARDHQPGEVAISPGIDRKAQKDRARDGLAGCAGDPSVRNAEEDHGTRDGDHDRQGQDGDPEMVGRDQDGADDDEPKDRADHVHRAVVAGGLGPLIRRHLVGQHALVRALRRVRRHLEEDVDDQQHPVRRDKRDDREENHVADDAGSR